MTRFALNAGAALDTEALGVFVALWMEGFSDLPDAVLEAAFRKTLKTAKFWPVKVADVREHVSRAEDNAAGLEAEKKWERVLSYANSLSPDIPERNRPKISEQTQAAIRAAGGFDWIRDCPMSDLQWAKKRFVEAFTSWRSLEKDKFLLPDGEVKKLLVEAAQAKALPMESRA